MPAQIIRFPARRPGPRLLRSRMLAALFRLCRPRPPSVGEVPDYLRRDVGLPPKEGRVPGAWPLRPF